MAEKWFQIYKKSDKLSRGRPTPSEECAIHECDREQFYAPIYIYTEAEHEEVMKLRELYRVVCGLRLKDGYPLGIAHALDQIDGGTYNPKIGDCNVDG